MLTFSRVACWPEAARQIRSLSRGLLCPQREPLMILGYNLWIPKHSVGTFKST